MIDTVVFNVSNFKTISSLYLTHLKREDIMSGFRGIFFRKNYAKNVFFFFNLICLNFRGLK